MVSSYQHAMELKNVLLMELMTINSGDDIFKLREDWVIFSQAQKDIKNRLQNNQNGPFVGLSDLSTYLSQCELYFGLLG